MHLILQIGGKTRDETGHMYPRMNALIHGWVKYPWIINLHEWGAIYVMVFIGCRGYVGC